MLKKFFAGLFTLAVTTASLAGQSTLATDAGAIIIDNTLALCEYVQTYHNQLTDETTDCSAYSATDTATTITRPLYIFDHVVFKNLDLIFTSSASPFIIRSGSLTIDGGHYTSPSCVVWIQYRNDSTPAYYVPSTTVTINSGVFEATVSTAYSTEAPSPVCVVSPVALTAEETQTVMNNYLPTGRRYVNLAPVRLMAMRSTPATGIPSASGYAHIDKDGDIRTPIEYLQTTLIAVVGDEGSGEPEPETQPAEPETPTTPETPTEPATTVIPKAPNTGRR